LVAVMTQRPELNGPPACYTSDWDAARDSVRRLAALRPAVMACGHGLPMAGREAADDLERSRQSSTGSRARNTAGTRVGPPITDETGFASAPTFTSSLAGKAALAIGGGLLLGAALFAQRRRKSVV
jgi:hypothetical protein